MSAPVTVFESPEQLGWILAGEILERTRAALRRRRRFLLGCPAGRSLRTTYRALARRAAEANDNLSHVVIVMMDEFLVPDGKDGFVACPLNAHYSCLGFAFRDIQAPVNRELPADACIPDHHLWIPDPSAPGEYDERLAAAGGVDFFLLASGASDGHVAFNPPGSSLESGTGIVALAAKSREDNLATFPQFESLSEVPTHGVSVGLGTIARLSHEAALVMHGDAKRESARRVQAAESFDPDWPATVIHECRRGRIYVDKAAAAR
jgi:glucosamine-6-phosphate deaminase